MFGGVFRILQRHADRYEVELNDEGPGFLGRLNATGFGGGETGSGAFRNHASLFLGESRIQVQHEGVGVSAQLGDQKRHLLRHQPADKLHVAREPIEFRDGDRAGFPVTARLGERGGELRAALERVGGALLAFRAARQL